MQKTISDEFTEKFETLVEWAENDFPDDEWYIDVTMWDDDTFMLIAEHNRPYQRNGGQWRVRIVIGSEESTVPPRPYTSVEYKPDPDKTGSYVVWTENEDIYQ